jgi:hypothetical protein
MKNKIRSTPNKILILFKLAELIVLYKKSEVDKIMISKKFLILLPAFMLVVAFSGCTSEQPIGGERDEHGCLVAAGYSWNEEIQACTRDWELDENQQRAAEIAVDYVGSEEGLTVTEIVTARCPGCFIIYLEDENRDLTSVNIEDWIAVSKTLVRHTCTEEEKQAEICTMEYLPVCGYKIDGSSKTYGNGCQACSDGVEYWEFGECER